ncbi:type II and III secretion system protein family protein [Planctomicrobium sp. SH664]|uniref:type II and III secretion system protein family protein n=1 Tax=Planctomicrobium sp. SH664 TaxID=3448125 RepID=UPI003F5B8144
MPKTRNHGLSRWLRGILFATMVSQVPQIAVAQPERLPPSPSAPAAPAGTPAVAPLQQPTTGEQVFRVIAPTTNLSLMHLDSRILELAQRIKVVDGFNPDKLTVTALSPNRIRVRGENPGVTTLKLVDEFDAVYSVEFFVQPDTRELEAYLRKFFPGSAIEVTGLRDGVVLRGWVTDPTHIPQIMRIAESMYPPDLIQSQLQVGGASQVQLHVKVAEVQRTKLREFGFNFIFNGENGYVAQTVGGISPLNAISAAGALPFGGPAAPVVLPSALSGSELQFALTGNSLIFQGFFKALQTEGLAKILAEPILVTTSGRPASMLSGGEFPILVPQSLGNVTIQYREFGVSMEMVPVVLGDGRLRLDVAPEVSERDFSNSVSTNGFVVPGITTRRVNTQVEMRFGETLMVGGLISSRRFGTMQRIPFLGELPWIGAAFSRKSYTIGETELIILVTPQMVAPMLPCQVPTTLPGQNTDMPTDRELILDGQLEVPNFGPECPPGGCPPGQLMTPQMACPPGSVMPGEILPGQPQLPSSADGLISPEPTTAPNIPSVPPPVSDDPNTSASRSRMINPFRSTASRSNPNPGAVVPASAESAGKNSPGGVVNAGHNLPGPITPGSSSVKSGTR